MELDPTGLAWDRASKAHPGARILCLLGNSAGPCEKGSGILSRMSSY